MSFSPVTIRDLHQNIDVSVKWCVNTLLDLGLRRRLQWYKECVLPSSQSKLVKEKWSESFRATFKSQFRKGSRRGVRCWVLTHTVKGSTLKLTVFYSIPAAKNWILWKTGEILCRGLFQIRFCITLSSKPVGITFKLTQLSEGVI